MAITKEIHQATIKLTGMHIESLTRAQAKILEAFDMAEIGDEGITITITVKSDGYLSHELGEVERLLDVHSMINGVVTSKIVKETIPNEKAVSWAATPMGRILTQE